MFKRIQRVFILEDIYRVDVDSNMVAIGEQAMILFHAMQFSVPISNNTHCYNSGSPKQSPKILSALYAYDGCMGGVNDFSTEEEYMQEIKRFFGSKIMKKQYFKEKLYCGGGAWRERGLPILSLRLDFAQIFV